MFGWMTKKLKAGRISMSIAQLEHEIQALSPEERASVLVTAMHFCQSFVDQGGEGVLIARAIENPRSLSEEEAYSLYWNLESILMAGQKENEAAFSRAKERMGEKFAESFRKDMKNTEIAVRLLLSRVAAVVDRENRSKLSVVARCIDDAVPHVSEATKRLRLSQSLVGSPKGDSYYAGLDATARTYAFAYMASFYGKQSQP